MGIAFLLVIIAAVSASVAVAKRMRSRSVRVVVAAVMPPVLAWMLYWLILAGGSSGAARDEHVAFQFLALLAGVLIGTPAALIGLLVLGGKKSEINRGAAPK